MKQMKAGAGITEGLKAADQMKWIGLMNGVRNSVEEIVLNGRLIWYVLQKLKRES